MLPLKVQRRGCEPRLITCRAAQYILYTTAGTLLLTLVERGRRETGVVVVVVREQETLLLDAIERQVYILLWWCYCHSYTAWLNQWWSLKVTHPTCLTRPLTHMYHVTPGQLCAGADTAIMTICWTQTASTQTISMTSQTHLSSLQNGICGRRFAAGMLNLWLLLWRRVKSTVQSRTIAMSNSGSGYFSMISSSMDPSIQKFCATSSHQRVNTSHEDGDECVPVEFRECQLAKSSKRRNGDVIRDPWQNRHAAGVENSFYGTIHNPNLIPRGQN